MGPELQMGRMIYGNAGTEIDFEDRLLAHLKVVIITKLRRDESFLLSWEHGQSEGSGRSSVWMHPAVPLHFRFYGNRQPPLNRAWIEDLMLAANSTGGLVPVPEPEQPE
jgi:hypothetical protein